MIGQSRRQFLRSTGIVGAALLAGCTPPPFQAPPAPAGGSLPWQAQPPAKVPRLGFLSTDESPIQDAFRQGLAELGYREGQNILIEQRNAERNDQLDERAAELVQLGVDLIVVPGPVETRAAMRATSTIPIVFLGASDPVAQGLVQSLGRPGGNVTGHSVLSAPLSAKRVELLKQTLPNLQRVAVPVAAGGAIRGVATRAVQETAEALGVEVELLEVGGPEDFERTFEAAVRAGAEAITIPGAAPFAIHRPRLVELAARHRLPDIYVTRAAVVVGGLMSYGPNFPSLFRRGAYYVDRILKGANPADLPIEEPHEFEFVINLTTARTLGITIPEHVLVRATEAIP